MKAVSSLFAKVKGYSSTEGDAILQSNEYESPDQVYTNQSYQPQTNYTYTPKQPAKMESDSDEELDFDPRQQSAAPVHQSAVRHTQTQPTIATPQQQFDLFQQGSVRPQNSLNAINTNQPVFGQTYQQQPFAQPAQSANSMFFGTPVQQSGSTGTQDFLDLSMDIAASQPMQKQQQKQVNAPSKTARDEFGEFANLDLRQERKVVYGKPTGPRGGRPLGQ